LNNVNLTALLNLPTVTLFCLDSIDPAGAKKVMDYSARGITFGDILLLTEGPKGPITSLNMYSIFMLTELHKYISTPHVLVVQRDGFVLNPASFRQEWLDLDYIGPIFMQYDKVGSGGFSLRSKRCIERTACIGEWDGTKDHADRIQAGLGYYEDGMISMSPKFKGLRIGTLGQAADFAQGGNRNPAYFRERPFGFHRTWQHVDFKTGYVDSTDTSADITSSYDLSEL
jgi:hypothetical protein